MAKVKARPLKPGKEALVHTAAYDPPGLPIAKLAKKKLPLTVLIASTVRQYSSGPSVAITTGYVHKGVNGEIRVGVSWNPHAVPLEEFQCWWPLPVVAFTEVKPKKGK